MVLVRYGFKKNMGKTGGQDFTKCKMFIICPFPRGSLGTFFLLEAAYLSGLKTLQLVTAP